MTRFSPLLLYECLTQNRELTSNNGMTNRTKTIGVRVTPEEKRKFEDYAEEHNEFDSASRMMRVLAHRHIKTEGHQETAIDEEDIVRSVDIALDPVIERLENLEEHVTEIDSQTSNDDEIDKLAREIYDSLPEHLDGEDLPSMQELAPKLAESTHSLAQTLSTPSAWAEHFGVDRAQARRACARMLEYYPDVEYYTIEMGDVDLGTGDEAADVQISERRYYRRPGGA